MLLCPLARSLSLFFSLSHCFFLSLILSLFLYLSLSLYLSSVSMERGKQALKGWEYENELNSEQVQLDAKGRFLWRTKLLQTKSVGGGCTIRGRIKEPVAHRPRSCQSSSNEILSTVTAAS
jgi:hypothetical protein